MTTAKVLTTDVLRAFRQILHEHHQHRENVARGLTNEPLLLAIAIDERERLQGLLEEVLRAEDGLLVDTSTSSDRAPLLEAGTPAVDRLTRAVAQALADINALPEAAENLQLYVSAEEVTITAGTAWEAASRGQRALRALMISLFSIDLRANALAGLVYAEESLDQQHKSIVWRLLMQLPRLLDRPAASTLLIVAGDAEIQVNLHCTGDPSLRWRVYDTGLQTRHARERDTDAIDLLAGFPAEDAPLIVVMLGAGASAGHLPLGNTVRDEALKNFIGRSVDRHNYDDIAREFYRRLDRAGDRLLPGERDRGPEDFIERLTLERVLREEQFQERSNFSQTLRWFRRQHDDAIARLAGDLSQGLLDDDPLRALVALRRRLVLVTVNFDRIIETKGRDDVRAFITQSDMADLDGYLEEYSQRGGPVPLVKAHGDIMLPDTIVADITTTSSGLARHVHAALVLLRERLLAQAISPLWHVGYSMRDIDLEDYWADPGFSANAAERWVTPLPDAAVARFITKHRIPKWALKPDPQTLDGSLISLTAADFFGHLNRQASMRWGT